MQRVESSESSKRGPIVSLMLYSLSMIILPLGSFFLSRFLINRVFDIDANLYAAVISVITVHCILGAFVYKAFKEDKAMSEKPSEKVD